MLTLSILGNLIILSIILILISFYFFYLNSIINNRRNTKKVSSRKILKKVVPKEDSSEYQKAKFLLDKSYSNIDVPKFYYMKLVCLIVGIFFSLGIFLTNTIVKQHKYLTNNITTISSVADSSTKENVVEENFYVLKKYVNINKIYENDKVSEETVKNVLIYHGTANKDNINDITNDLIKDISKIKNLYSPIRLMEYLIFAILTFFIPDIFIRMYSKIKKEKINEELSQLMNLFTIICSNSNITAQNILSIIVNNSYHLKISMTKFQMAYLTNREDSYTSFLNNPKMKNISRIIALLRQIEKSDKDAALKSIIRTNENSEKLRKISYENKIEKKEGILLFLFALGVLYLLKIVIDYSMGGLSGLNATKF